MLRINKSIELLEQGFPVFTTAVHDLTYEVGLKLSQTWADVIQIEFEHHPFDVRGLSDFMCGLRDAGPTPSGHLTPGVICTLPSNCITAEEVRYNAWQIRHVLATGVHGILHTHARQADAVRWFVASCRYPFQTIGFDKEIPEGLRGAGGQDLAATIWGISPDEYVELADPWPMNPSGELLLGLKIEDRHCLENVNQITKVPGIGFAEWGPGDMAMSFGNSKRSGHDPPYSPAMEEARNTIKASLDKSRVAFLSSWNDESMTEEEKVVYAIDVVGARIVHVPDARTASIVAHRYGRAW